MSFLIGAVVTVFVVVFFVCLETESSPGWLPALVSCLSSVSADTVGGIHAGLEQPC